MMQILFLKTRAQDSYDYTRTTGSASGGGMDSGELEGWNYQASDEQDK